MSKNINRLKLLRNHLAQAEQQESLTCGGTSQVLPNERAKASFDVKALTDILNGGPEMTKKRKFIESTVPDDSNEAYKRSNFDRNEWFEDGVKGFIGIHKKFSNFKPDTNDMVFMSQSSTSTLSLANSHGIFYLAVATQGNDEQQKYWLPKILRFEITGAYAQTELGHGSNVRGLHTTATFDPTTDEFVINTPTLRSIKWWPGALGKASTHCALYAQLIVNGEEKGVHIFMMQIRDDKHLPLPGIQLGDLGNKMGDHGNDTGFMVVENVRIPRTNMLMKYHKLTRDGKYEQVEKADPKIHYFIMLSTRVSMVCISGARLAMASTIAIRYSAVRTQGFKDVTGEGSYKAPEYQVIDYRIQLYRLMKQLANSYAFKFTSLWMSESMAKFTTGFGGKTQISSDGLKELATTSAGLKSLTTYVACNGMEDLRKSCGGNGYLLSSGISQILLDYILQVTAEGDYIILALLTARSLLKGIGGIVKGKQLKGVFSYLNVVGQKGFKLENIHPGSFKDSFQKDTFKYLLEMFKYRAIKRCLDVAQDFNEELASGKSFADAWNSCSNELLNSTYGHCYYIIMANFINKVSEVTDQNIKKVLTRLVVMFGLSNFLDDNWGDIISNNDFKAIRKVVKDVLSELRPDAVPLVDAFDFHDKVLKSNIGRYDGNVYEALYESAKKCTLNRQDPFIGYEQHLKPHLNKDLLKKGNKPIPELAKF